MIHQEQYDALIALARENPSPLPGEKHHVVPKCLHRWRPYSFGVNAPENLLHLSHQQHLMAHYLLWEIWKGNKMMGPKMATALTMMMDTGRGAPTPAILDAYAEAKIAKNKALSEARSGEGNPMYGKKRPEISKAQTGEKNPMYGKGHLFTGDKNPMYGKPRAEGAGKPSKPVINTETGETWESAAACSRALGLRQPTTINRIKRKSFGGIWMYLEDYEKEQAKNG